MQNRYPLRRIYTTVHFLLNFLLITGTFISMAGDRNNKKKLKYQIRSARRISGITFIGDSQHRNTGKPNNLSVLGSYKTKGPKQDSQIL